MTKVNNEIAIKNKLDGKSLFKISRFKEVIKRTVPHKHDAYLEIIYLSQGAGFHWIDTQKIQIVPPVVFILSGQLHYWEMTAIPNGYVVLFREDFFNVTKQNDLFRLIRSVENSVAISIQPNEKLEFIFSEIEREYQNPSVNSVQLIQGYLQVLMVKLYRQMAMPDTPDNGFNSDQIFRNFLKIIRHANPITNLKVNAVADQLHLSPQHLNSISRKAVGKSASELIREQVVLEAKRFLLHSDKNISEIAFALNFSDASHFVKYFKKITGDTPQVFRSRYFQ